jgi:hypothetical protein
MPIAAILTGLGYGGLFIAGRLGSLDRASHMAVAAGIIVGAFLITHTLLIRAHRRAVGAFVASHLDGPFLERPHVPREVAVQAHDVPHLPAFRTFIDRVLGERKPPWALRLGPQGEALEVLLGDEALARIEELRAGLREDQSHLYYGWPAPDAALILGWVALDPHALLERTGDLAPGSSPPGDLPRRFELVPGWA